MAATYPWETASKYPPRGISSNGMDICENPDTAPVLIGHTLAYCAELENALNEALSKAEEYFEELVKAGLRTKPKTTEEMLLEAMSAIKHLADKIERLEGGNGDKPDTRESENSPEASKSKSGGSAGKSRTGAAGDAGVQ